MSAGGWSSYSSDVTAEQAGVLETALKGLVGAGYKPIGIQTQVVAGTNYCFFCIGEAVTPEASAYLAKVRVYQDPEQEIKLQGIDVIHPY